MRHLLWAQLAITMAALQGCSALHDMSKGVEGRVYDEVAEATTSYCKWAAGKAFFDQERLEARREIRQRGSDGPQPPAAPIPGLDAQTAQGQGPVVRVYCSSDPVPDAVWLDLVKE